MRTILATVLAAFVGLAGPGAAGAEPIAIDWGDLIPPAAAAAPDPVDEMERRLGLTPQDRRLTTPRGLVQHGQLGDVPGGVDVVHTYDGRTVSLSGFVIPLDYTAEGVTSFMLVPFVGACIHVPPPPPNQLVFVTSDRPVGIRGLFSAYTVTGTFGTMTTETDLARVGYVMTADAVTPYD
ncbi:DUF3299 domain-containing protein [Acuticoccus sp. I52.16.1]|uniref:DUF3299 domain-containing protein n=1 Tax=Acuticoccus sp. I52.16.1 TaxID=2928472 RepID=UPI001FD16DD5|nr:DUF3299 domain-containing protein [Acuticoccus sp. I52.16.1]UOM32997.1 DUF3299 domain-containing protein [Acuticoccus sp. I52.16.1]